MCECVCSDNSTATDNNRLVVGVPLPAPPQGHSAPDDGGRGPTPARGGGGGDSRDTKGSGHTKKMNGTIYKHTHVRHRHTHTLPTDDLL